MLCHMCLMGGASVAFGHHERQVMCSAQKCGPLPVVSLMCTCLVHTIMLCSDALSWQGVFKP